MEIVSIVLVANLLLMIGVIVKLTRMRRLFTISQPSKSIAPLDELPAVSLCIPARDETHAMTQCLERALQSSYPKLEIIVLDDGSRDNTQLLIKSFAHAGVRFIEGVKLPEGWLGKNHALDTLARQASGSIVVFADVDTQFAPDSIERLVAYMVSQQASMVSVLPKRQDTYRASMKFAALRHFWTVIGHTRNHPAVSSSVWMVKRDVLIKDINGLTQFPLAVRPEVSVAKQFMKDDSYRFVMSSKYIGVASEKKLSSQQETAIRIYYPVFHSLGCVLRALGLLLYLLPYMYIVVGIYYGRPDIIISAVATAIVGVYVYGYYLRAFQSYNSPVGLLPLLFVVVHEIYLLLASIVLHKTNKVTWKGRPVTSQVK